MRLRVGGKRSPDLEASLVSVGTVGDSTIRLEFATKPDASNRGRPRHKVTLEVTADDLTGLATSDPTPSAVVRQLVVMLEAAGVTEWRANRYLERAIDCPGCPGDGCPRCHGGSLR